MDSSLKDISEAEIPRAIAEAAEKKEKGRSLNTLEQKLYLLLKLRQSVTRQEQGYQ